uniref:MULE transposase domain-containing protein n=1 Tax=Lactuca sativa TaxID=4236 RepID=A0A9R1VAD3_LACSA|nr:hypothetical protein LSAT_V11C500267730 [Lactuca sativa]
MDHEPRQEFVSRLDKCKDHFLNILVCDANIRNVSMTDEVKYRVDHGNDFQNDEEAEEVVTDNYIIHDPNVRWDKMELKLGDVFESLAQLKFYVTNYVVNEGYQIYFQKSENRRIVARSGKRHEDNKCPFRLYVAWMYNDRTFQVKGELLIAIGRDANNQVFPIAWVVVDVENKDNWTWFLELLKDDLDLGTGADLVVISDQHKGLLESIKVILPHVEHMQCARHIYANFNKAFSGLELKKLFWACAMSCVEVENGISECFNSIILEARKKPLIIILEEIRIYIMDRFSFMNDECSKWKGNICPEVIKKMNLFGKNFRLWDLFGIPYVHVIAAINYIHQTPNGYISDYFSLNKFKECYSTSISPVNRSNMWPLIGYNKPLPHVGRKMPGRPRTKRKEACKSERE